MTKPIDPYTGAGRVALLQLTCAILTQVSALGFPSYNIALGIWGWQCRHSLENKALFVYFLLLPFSIIIDVAFLGIWGYDPFPIETGTCTGLGLTASPVNRFALTMLIFCMLLKTVSMVFAYKMFKSTKATLVAAGDRAADSKLTTETEPARETNSDIKAQVALLSRGTGPQASVFADVEHASEPMSSSSYQEAESSSYADYSYVNSMGHSSQHDGYHGYAGYYEAQGHLPPQYSPYGHQEYPQAAPSSHYASAAMYTSEAAYPQQQVANVHPAIQQRLYSSPPQS